MSEVLGEGTPVQVLSLEPGTRQGSAWQPSGGVRAQPEGPQSRPSLEQSVKTRSGSVEAQETRGPRSSWPRGLFFFSTFSVLPTPHVPVCHDARWLWLPWAFLVQVLRCEFWPCSPSCARPRKFSASPWTGCSWAMCSSWFCHL